MASCLKKINGKLPNGATFNVAGNEYKAHNFSSCLLSKDSYRHNALANAKGHLAQKGLAKSVKVAFMKR